MAANRSEEIVSWICEKCFLTLWSHSNPLGKKNKELCDVLVVCDPYVLIFSVKEINFKQDDDDLMSAKRWERKAIRASIDQLNGASRWLKTADRVICKDGTGAIELPAIERRQTFRIAIALGAKGQLPVEFMTNDANGVVHVMTENGLQHVLKELDTIVDFVEYLQNLEAFEGDIIVEGNESDLVAFYMSNNRIFPSDCDTLIISNDFWQRYSDRPERLRKLELDKMSYKWDELIERFIMDFLEVQGLADDSLARAEQVIRVMAMERRFYRRILSKAFLEFYEDAINLKTRARTLQSDSGVAYMFLFAGHEGDRLGLLPELSQRAFMALGMNKDAPCVIGILIDYDVRYKTISFAIELRHRGEWTAEDQASFEKIQKGTGAWTNPQISRIREDEFPLE